MVEKTQKMRNNYLVNLILISVIGLLLLYNNDFFTSESPIHTLSLTPSHEINYIIIKRDALDNITLQKKADGWEVTQPIQAQANATRVSLLLSLLSHSAHEKLEVTATTSLNKFGLKPENLSLHLNNDIFIFGNIEPISKHRYVLHKRIIYLIEDDVTPMMRANPTSFINNRLLASNQNISKIKLPQLNGEKVTTSSSLTITKVNGSWQSDDAEHSADQLTQIIDNWQHAYALQVILLSDAELDKLTGETITIWHNDTSSSPTELLVQINKRSVFIIDIASKLKYQFPIMMKNQLFIHNEPED